MAFFRAKDVTKTISKARAAASGFRTGGCAACGLCKNAVRSQLDVKGKGRKRILIVYEQPNEKQGRDDQFQYIMEDLGIDVARDCWETHAVQCSTPDGREGTDLEIEFCRGRLNDQIKELQPQLILLLGKAGVTSLIEPRFVDDDSDDEENSAGGLAKWRGFVFPEQSLGAWVMATFDPLYVNRLEGTAAPVLWEQDLKRALEYLDTPIPEPWDPRKHVEILYKPEQVIKYLRSLNRKELMAFDYEGTGLKPQAPGHRIVSASVCNSLDYAVSFPIDDPDIQAAVRVALAEEALRKTAHNMMHEETWSRYCLRQPVRGWTWCSMLGAHLLDNRNGVCSLKFQSYVQFGIPDWSGSISKYLKGVDPKDGNSLNRIHRAPLDKLLLYGGTDSLIQFRLAKKQMEEAKDQKLMKSYKLLHDGALALVPAQLHGLRVDIDYCNKKLDHLNRRKSMLQKEIMDGRLGKYWRARFGQNAKIGSDDQLAVILTEDIGCEFEKLTASGKVSMDAESLRKLKMPEVDDILEHRKIDKIGGTYLSGWIRETVDGFMHPFFKLHSVVTYRSSSSNPNFQNVPKREAEAKQTTRRAITAHEGQFMLAMDYSGVEVKVAACYHKDPTMLKYIHDPSTDMHRDMAMECFQLSLEQFTKPHRQAAKNKFVFPEFYGDWWKACSVGLWNDAINEPLKDGTPMRDHLASKGIKDRDDFAEHIKEVERRFWEERFPVYTQWKEDWLKAYNKKGWFRTHTGFICRSLMMKNDAINYPVQGSAFHCLLWSFARINEVAIEEKWRSRPIGQIHDEILLSVDPDEADHVVQVCERIMTQDLVKEFKWINVPMEVEGEATFVNEPWVSLKGLSSKGRCPACQTKTRVKEVNGKTKETFLTCLKCGTKEPQ